MITFNPDFTWKYELKTAASEPVLLTGTYDINFSKHPVPLTVRNIPQLTHPLHTIIDFVTRDQIRISQFAPRWRTRPISFDPHSELILRRSKRGL